VGLSEQFLMMTIQGSSSQVWFGFSGDVKKIYNDDECTSIFSDGSWADLSDIIYKEGQPITLLAKLLVQ